MWSGNSKLTMNLILDKKCTQAAYNQEIKVFWKDDDKKKNNESCKHMRTYVET